MKGIWFLFYLFFLVESGFSQELIWEKRIALSNYEYFGSAAKTPDNHYLVVGSSDRWLMLNPIVLSGAIIMKFDADGDTLWTKFTGYYGSFGKIIAGENGLYYALLIYREPLNNEYRTGIYVFNDEGQNLGIIPVNASPGNLVGNMEFRHGYIWLSGERRPSLWFPSSPYSYDFNLKKLRYDGTEVFSFVYNANNQTCRGDKMEFMPNGNILFSGSVGNKIGAFEIDTAGNQIQYRTYVTNNFNMAFDGPRVRQMTDGNRLVGGVLSTNPGSFYVGKHDTSGVRIWGGISKGTSDGGHIYTDGSIVHLKSMANPPSSEIIRLSQDSTVISTLNFIGPGLIQDFKGIFSIYHESDSSGIAVGQIGYLGPLNLYIAKFGKLGIPFEPTSAEAFESMKTDAKPIPFPNPGSANVKFTILAGPGQVSFTDMQGRIIWKGEYLPEKGISTQTFPSGLYQYRLERNGKVWTGKWEKN